MKRIAAPLVGGIFTSFALELLVYPAIYELWKGRSISKVDEQEEVQVSKNRQQGQEFAVAART
jgi:Cu(I)/Ag(I) efflux system membrane protein CusA/SilA